MPTSSRPFQRAAAEYQALNERLYLASIIGLRLRRPELINCLIPLAIAFSHHPQKKSAIASRLGCSHPSPSSSLNHTAFNPMGTVRTLRPLFPCPPNSRL